MTGSGQGGLRPLRLWLVRHALVPGAAEFCYGRSDWPADPDATQDAAQALAAALAGAGLAAGTGDASATDLPIWCSPRTRARQLAEALCALRPGQGAPLIDPRLAEMDFGAWEGRRWDGIGRAAIDAWMADFDGHRVGGGESAGAVLARVGDALHAVRTQGAREALWVTHAGVIRATLWLHQGGTRPLRSPRDWPQQAVAPGGWLVLDFDAPAGGGARAI